ncbi:PucC family protein [Pontivivens ytuae]|uniref:PucC family protein n=1 Tax=Pontivivens ytuae TaxID=2789856 RepID=A0A7S9LQW2_9RHOB|nr:PucC family protein [Pontivivens ytuae]QPH53449.1 PucC family protein [Pontivivens ytuae]
MKTERHPLTQFGMKLLPFADAASEGLPMRRLLRLSLFQVSVGMATVMLLGTLNRVMIVELSVAAWLVAAMVALPVLVAPFRALLGFRSDTYRSAIGWKRVPYLWFGTLWQMGGLAVMPFALIVLSGDQTLGPSWAGEVLAALSFIMTGLGLAMTQTAGLALAADQAEPDRRGRVVALLYVMFLIGMGVSALVIGGLLVNFSQLRLIQVVQGAAAATLIVNIIALWKQERMAPTSAAERASPRPAFRDAWADFARGGQAGRLIAVVFLGTLAFSMQDVLLEPYGGEILGLSVSATTLLTAFWALGALLGFSLAAKWLATHHPYRLAVRGLLIGIAAFCAVVFAEPMGLAPLFFAGAFGIGLGGGLFAVATLVAAMALPVEGIAGRGLALGAWGGAQATAAGVGILTGGALRDLVGQAAMAGRFGEVLASPATGYSIVYHVEIGLLFVTLLALGPLLTAARRAGETAQARPIALAELPT